MAPDIKSRLRVVQRNHPRNTSPAACIRCCPTPRAGPDYEFAGSRKRFQHRAPGFLDLQEQRLIGPRHQQYERTAESHAADAGHFRGNVEPELFEQDAPLFGQ